MKNFIENNGEKREKKVNGERRIVDKIKKGFLMAGAVSTLMTGCSGKNIPRRGGDNQVRQDKENLELKEVCESVSQEKVDELKNIIKDSTKEGQIRLNAINTLKLKAIYAREMLEKMISNKIAKETIEVSGAIVQNPEKQFNDSESNNYESLEKIVKEITDFLTNEVLLPYDEEEEFRKYTEGPEILRDTIYFPMFQQVKKELEEAQNDKDENKITECIERLKELKSKILFGGSYDSGTMMWHAKLEKNLGDKVIVEDDCLRHSATHALSNIYSLPPKQGDLEIYEELSKHPNPRVREVFKGRLAVVNEKIDYEKD